ncbi:NFAT activation molecule 1 [Lissotriton helveticus]
MAPRGPLSGLLLLALLYRGRGEVIDVTQTPKLQVALAPETVSVTCRVLAPRDYFAIAVGIYRVDVAGHETLVIGVPFNNRSQLASHNANLTLSTLSFSFQPVKDADSTGSHYYCIAIAPKWTRTRFRGDGTFIHLRYAGYLRNRRRGLHIFLKTSCGLLTALSLVGTGLLLLWKKKGYPTWSSVRARHAAHQDASQADGRREEAVSGLSSADPTYTALEHNSADTYDIIEREAEMQPSASVQSGPMPSTPKHKQLEKKKSPDVQAGGKKRTSDMMPSTPKHKQLEKKKSPDVQAGGKKRTSDMPAAKQEEIFDTVYENL